ncbi:Alpha/Beta hydrolase protein [Diaporthe sp. PMI_573]|nr:Alpha/Beta hydrolase protein [Diaporthaceae sp. PMI_573]
MARTTQITLLGLGAVLFGLAAISLGSARALLLTVASYLPSRLVPAPVVTDSTLDVKYIGTRSADLAVEHFHSIFYAEDTSGPNRFAPPAPVTPPRGSVIDATTPGAWCPQGTGDVLPFTSRVSNISENCLSLRIARLSGTSSGAKLPVAVWIHGGGHALGSGEEILYEPDGLLRQAGLDGQPLIFVAINYRLGFFGFATSQAMIEAGQTNAGLRDQRAALEWVQNNIHSFGGDPTRVTAIGQSVGGSDIGLQMTAFGGAEGVPFQKAVMMSGAPGLNFNTMSSLVADNTAMIAKKVGCVKDGADTQTDAILECLKEAPFDVLTNLSVSAMRAARPPFGEGFFFPTYDGDFIQDRPSKLIREGKVVKNIAAITAWVTNDGAWYTPPTTATDDDVISSFTVSLTLTQSTINKLLELYPVSDFDYIAQDQGVSPQYYRAAQINRDLWFTCPVLDFAWQYGRHNSYDVRLYEHNATRFAPSYALMGVPMWKVAHLSDIPYVLNSQSLGGGADNSADQLALSATISKRIVKFVTSTAPDMEWSPAFKGKAEDNIQDKLPSSISLQLFGGPYGNRQVTVREHPGEGDNTATEAEKAVAWERLFKRCNFINSAEVRSETSV